MAAADKKTSQAFVDQAAREPGATKTASGLIMIPITPGTGASPKATDTVTVNYEGRLTDGTVFDSSRQHGGPATVPLNGVIKCWTEALQLVKVGGKSRLVCPLTLRTATRAGPRSSSRGRPSSSRSSCWGSPGHRLRPRRSQSQRPPGTTATTPRPTTPTCVNVPRAGGRSRRRHHLGNSAVYSGLIRRRDMRTHVPAVSNARAELIGGPDQPDGTFDRLDHRVQGR